MYTMIAGTTPALTYAGEYLLKAGIQVIHSFRWDVSHLLLDVPSFRPGGLDPNTMLSSLPRDITVWGGNLDHPALNGYHCVDFLKDEKYLTENAAITADCTLDLMEPLMQTSLQGNNILIIGWGRIGKSLATKLKDRGCIVTVAARKDSDRTRLADLGFLTMDTEHLKVGTDNFDAIINTVPAMILRKEQQIGRKSCIKIDLATKRGIEGEDVIWARGLPGKYAPEKSGKFIAETFLRILKEGEK